MAEKKPSKDSKPFSLYGMTPEEAIQQMFAAGSPKPSAGDILSAAFEEWSATGTTTAKCDSCGSAIEFRSLSPQVWTSHCECGKFNNTLKGL
jgi:hypothetical protein